MGSSNGTLFGAIGRRRRLLREIGNQRERLYRLAWSWCHDSHTADDLVQEALTRAISKLDQLRDEDRLRVWLTQILANLYRDAFRRVTPQTGFDADLLAGSDAPDQSANTSQLVERTRAAIARLPQDQRQVLSLIDVAGFSYVDTAVILDVPVGTIMSRLSRARQRMRQILEQQGIGHADVIPLRRP